MENNETLKEVISKEFNSHKFINIFNNDSSISFWKQDKNDVSQALKFVTNNKHTIISDIISLIIDNTYDLLGRINCIVKLPKINVKKDFKDNIRISWEKFAILNFFSSAIMKVNDINFTLTPRDILIYYLFYNKSEKIPKLNDNWETTIEFKEKKIIHPWPMTLDTRTYLKLFLLEKSINIAYKLNNINKLIKMQELINEQWIDIELNIDKIEYDNLKYDFYLDQYIISPSDKEYFLKQEIIDNNIKQIYEISNSSPKMNLILPFPIESIFWMASKNINNISMNFDSICKSCKLHIGSLGTRFNLPEIITKTSGHIKNIHKFDFSIHSDTLDFINGLCPTNDSTFIYNLEIDIESSHKYNLYIIVLAIRKLIYKKIENNFKLVEI